MAKVWDDLARRDCRRCYYENYGLDQQGDSCAASRQIQAFAEQCRELAKPLGGQLKQTLEEMAKVWDDLARRLVGKLDADGRGAAHAKYLLAGLELLQSARRDSREWLLKQLNA
jgi:phytoene dehydrogenase-like protein